MQAALPIGVRSEPKTLDALYRLHAPAALRLAVLLTGDRALAEDVVQDAFVRVAARRNHLRDPEAFGPYLKRAVVNQVRSHFRHQRVVRKHAATTAPPVRDAESPDFDTREQLWNALQQLSERQRAALVLRFYDDMSERDIAHALGCRPGTVKALISRGLVQLRTEVGDV